jgi:signal transduction histidine kinase
MTETTPPTELLLPPRWRALFIAIGLCLLVLFGWAAWNARASRGRLFPGLLVDPYGSFSAIWWPGWHADSLPLHFPDRLVAVDGTPVAACGTAGFARALGRRIDELYAAGHRDVALTFRTRAGDVTIRRPIRALGAEEVLFFFGLYALIGLFVVWSGLAAVIFARRRSGAVAYAWWSVGTFVFLVCFYDYHTTTRLVPLFGLSTVFVHICLLGLAYSFPAPPRRRQRAMRAALVAWAVLWTAVGAGLLLGPHLGVDVTGLRVLIGSTAPLSLLTLPVAIVIRLRTGPSEQRQELRSAAWGLAAVPALLAVGFILVAVNGTGFVHVLLPFLAPILPMSIGYALIRHNILGITAVLTRRMLLVPIVVAAGVGAISVWLGVHALLRNHDLRGLIPWGPSLATLAVLSGLGYRWTNRAFFPARAKFRPTIQQLADDLASNRDAAAIRRSIGESVIRWLPTESARVVLPSELHQIPNRPTGYREKLAAGHALWTAETPWKRHLLLPMRSQGELRAVLVLAPKHQAALYTWEDLQLLDTIASLGAVSLHNANVIAELDTFRRFEVDAARDEKRLALGLLGAEVAHEIAYPLNFLRYLLGQGAAGVGAGKPLDAQDIDIAREEIGRLERMFSALRKLKIPLPHPEPVLVLPRARRALDLIRETILSKQIQVSVDLPPDLTVAAEPDPLVQIFANLLRNGAQAVAPGGQIGIGLRRRPGGLTLEVWDTGPGPSQEVQDRIFNPFVTDKEGSMGLGLAVTERLVRSFGWTISVARRGGRTIFAIDIPVDEGSAPHMAAPA